ncbi:MAG TPA: hypothetical protein VLA19_10520 [Herpetosiphonaceae bacterium]|nr:hypothetical protein [Herpetosiphonaceae bacterium]
MQQGHSSLGGSQLAVVGPPRGPVFRVARGLDPFESPDWRYVGGNRFDDPRCGEEGVDTDGCLRVIYAASQRAGAYVETIARYRIDLELLAGLEDVEDDEPPDPRHQPGVVPTDYRMQRRLGKTRLDPALRFVDIHAPETVQTLRPVLAKAARDLGLGDVDFSTVMGLHREITKHAALHIYEQRGADDRPLYAGIRYVSRLNRAWELWALFADRLVHTAGVPETIYPDDQGFVEAARLLNVNIEIFDGKCMFV